MLILDKGETYQENDIPPNIHRLFINPLFPQKIMGVQRANLQKPGNLFVSTNYGETGSWKLVTSNLIYYPLWGGDFGNNAHPDVLLSYESNFRKSMLFYQMNMVNT